MNGEQPVLSPEESAALMEALREGDVSREASVEKIDLAGGERPLRAAQPVIEKLGAQLASAFRRTLATTYRLSCEVLAEPGEIVSFGELRRRLEPGTIVGKLEALPSAAQAMMLLGPTFVAAVVDYGFGGLGDETQFLDEREPTALERNLLRRLCVLLSADATNTWKRDAEIDLQFLHLEGRNDLPSSLPDSQALLLVPFRLTFGTHQDELSLVLTAGAVDSLSRAAGKELGLPPIAIDAETKRRIKVWPVWVSSELGRCSLTVDELLDLTPGVVLRLDSMADEPVNVLINGVPKLVGQPVVSKGSMCTRIERWIAEETKSAPAERAADEEQEP